MIVPAYVPAGVVVMAALALVVLGCAPMPDGAGDGEDAAVRPTIEGDQPAEKIVLRWQTREAMPEASFEWTTPISESIVVASAVVCAETDSACRGVWRFEVMAEGRAEPLLAHVVSGDRVNIWQRHRVEFDASWADTADDVTLRFRAHRLGDTDPEDRVSGAEDGARLVWSRPYLVRPASRPNLLLISLDTLRADRLGSHGYQATPPITPTLDALATDGVRFAQAISQAPWTTPSHMSMLTGLYPSRHGVNQSFARFQNPAAGPYRGLSPATPTLASVLATQGYRTLAAVGNGPIAGALGFHQGFDVYQERTFIRDGNAVRWLKDRLVDVDDAPFFVFVQSFAPHAPYDDTTYASRVMDADALIDLEAHLKIRHEHAIDALRAHLRRAGLLTPEVTSALYDGGVRRADGIVGDVLAMLEELGVADDTLVIVTSDHGEEFGEHETHRFYDAHCATLYDELLHVPLILRFPGRIAPGVVVDRQVRSIDILPTALALLDVPTPEGVQGESLLPLLEDPDQPWRRWSLSEATCTGPEQKALRTESMKYVAAFAADVERSGIPGPLRWQRLFRLDQDPAEQASVHHLPEAPLESLYRALERRLAEITAEAPVGGSDRGIDVDESMRESLRALGYID